MEVRIRLRCRDSLHGREQRILFFTFRRLAIALLVLAAACAPPHEVDGRPFTLGVPDGVDAAGPLPLLILLHGYGANAEAQNFAFPFTHDVNARKFLYALPNGTVDADGKRFWNATDACCNYDRLPVDDVGFIRDLIAEVKREYPVDPQRVFVVGHSNGAFMALRLACEAGDVLHGVVAVAGAAWLDFSRCPNGAPVPVLTIHGTADEVIGFNGGATRVGRFPSAATTLSDFARRNRCTGGRATVGTSDFFGDATEETTREAFTGCPAGGQTELWSVEGAPHIPFFKPAWRAAVLDWLGVVPR